MSIPVRNTSDVHRVLWRVVGCLVFARVICTFGGVAMDNGSANLGASKNDVVRHFVTYSMIGKFGGIYVESLGSLAFLAAALLLARLLRGDGDVSGWLASLVGATAVLNVAALSIATATQGAAVYGGHHGTPLSIVAALSNVGDIAFFLSVGLAGAVTVCAGAAAITSRSFPAWFAYGGIVVGIAGMVAPLGAGQGLQNAAFMLHMVWWLALGVLALRRGAQYSAARKHTFAAA